MEALLCWPRPEELVHSELSNRQSFAPTEERECANRPATVSAHFVVRAMVKCLNLVLAASPSLSRSSLSLSVCISVLYMYVEIYIAFVCTCAYTSIQLGFCTWSERETSYVVEL